MKALHIYTTTILSAALLAVPAMAQDAPPPVQKQELESRYNLELKNKNAQVNQLKSVLNQKDSSIEDLKRQISAQEMLIQEKDILEAEINAMEGTLSKKEQKLKNMRDNLAYKQQQEEALNGLMNDMQNVLLEFEELKQENAAYKEKLKEKAALENKITGVQSEKQRLQENMQILDDEYKATQQELSHLRDVKLAEFEQQVVEKDMLILDLQTEIQSLEENFQKGQAQLEALQLSNQEKTVAAQTHEEQKQQINQVIAMMEEELEKLSRQNAALKGKNQQLEGKMMEMVASIRQGAVQMPPSAPQTDVIVRAANGTPVPPRKPQILSPELANMPVPERAVPKAIAKEMAPAHASADPVHGFNAKDFSPIAAPVTQDEMLNEAQSMERSFMGMGKTVQATQTPQDMLTKSHLEPDPVYVRSDIEPEKVVNEVKAKPPVPVLEEPLEPYVEPKVYFNPSVAVYGLLQSAEGYVPETFGLLKNMSGLDRLVYQWHEDNIYSSAEQKPIAQSSDFDQLARAYLVETEQKCQGDFAAVPVDTQDYETARIDSYDIACIIDGNGMNAAASLVFFTHDGTFTAVSYETATRYVDQAMDKRDRIIKTLSGAVLF